jgi:hypothetical protein
MWSLPVDASGRRFLPLGHETSRARMGSRSTATATRRSARRSCWAVGREVDERLSAHVGVDLRPEAAELVAIAGFAMAARAAFTSEPNRSRRFPVCFGLSPSASIYMLIENFKTPRVQPPTRLGGRQISAVAAWVPPSARRGPSSR